jgi:hypothetical protein
MYGFQPPDPVCKFCEDWCSGTCEGARVVSRYPPNANPRPTGGCCSLPQQVGAISGK